MTRRVLPLLAVLALVPAAPAQVTFAFNFADVTADNNLGFDDPTLGALRQSSLQSAANMLSSYFTGYAPRTVTVTVNTSYSDGGDSTVAFAGSPFFVVANSFQRNLVMQRIIDNNTNSQSSFGSMTWNFAHDFDYDDDVASNLLDFKSVAIHEMMHALGFASYLNVDGTGAGAGGNIYSFFDTFVTDVSGNRLVDTNAVYQGGSILTDGAFGDVYFNGANAKAANGGNRVRLYSPATFEDGSSISHLNTANFPANAFIMPPVIQDGPGVRTLSAVELGILMDLGYSVTAIPEPSTYALIFGLGALGYLTYRRRQAA